MIPMPALGATLLAYGDSLTGDYRKGPQQWPGLLQQLRPDLVVVSAGIAGDTSANFHRFRLALDAHRPAVVTLLLGTNDPVCTGAPPICDRAHTSPARTVRNLKAFAMLARQRGAAVFVLTPTPAVWPFADLCRTSPGAQGCNSSNPRDMATRDAFTAEVADRLRAWPRRRGLTVLDVRRVVTTGHTWAALTSDGLHLNGEGNRVIATFLAGELQAPRQDVHRQ